jgi:HlyD family secretion protein
MCFRSAADNKVTQTKVTSAGAGRPHRDHRRLDKADARVVASGGGFLADGDTVRVVEAPRPR